MYRELLVLMIQNKRSRLIFTNKPRYAHITPVMVDLFSLPVKFRIIFKVILLLSRCLHQPDNTTDHYWHMNAPVVNSVK